MQFDIFEIKADEGFKGQLEKKESCAGLDKYSFRFDWHPEKTDDNSSFEIKWRIPMPGIMYRWNPVAKLSKNIKPDWAAFNNSIISYSAPVEAFFDGCGENKYTWALDECAKTIFYKSGVVEEDGTLECVFKVPVKQFTGKSSAVIGLRIDKRKIPLRKALAEVSEWWAYDCGMTPAYVPSEAKEPAYSFWYSYHQDVRAEEVEEECLRAKALGFDLCIIDDGWQTADGGRGYSYCGDWEPAYEKIPDMAAHIKRVHDLGMKYMLWYSVPFIGYKSKNFERFKDKLLYNGEKHGAGILDPRYTEVREYITGIYKKALSDWKLDGFKLDFVDQWRYSDKNAPYCEGMDIPELSDAVDCLMSNIINELRAINPDVLIEFRQNYIGPNMRKFGNIFRVGDCPYDYISNRAGIFDLRMLMGNTAVHSDMLMWHRDEKPELAAIQIINIIFGVMQYSAKLENMTTEMSQMSKFWLDFMKKHKNLLLESEFDCYDPHLSYTWAKSVSENECFAAVYCDDKVITPDNKDTIYLANGSLSDRVIAEIKGKYKISTLDCRGREVSCCVTEMTGVSVLAIPAGGLAVCEKA